MKSGSILKQEITEHMKAAMRSGDTKRRDAIRLLLAAIKQREVDERTEIDDAAVIVIIEKMIKQRKDSITQYVAAKREDLADIERYEVNAYGRSISQLEFQKGEKGKRARQLASAGPYQSSLRSLTLSRAWYTITAIFTTTKTNTQ